MSTTFAERLDRALSEDGRTATAISEEAGVPRDQLSRWRGGKHTPGLESVISLVTVLGISGHWLLTGEEPMVPSTDLDPIKLKVIGRIVDGDVEPATLRDLADVGSSPEGRADRADQLRQKRRSLLEPQPEPEETPRPSSRRRANGRGKRDDT